jgi:hypothetical protein
VRGLEVAASLAPGRGSAVRGLEVAASLAPGRGSPAGPPPPVAAPPTSWLRAPSRGDPPLKLLAVRGGQPVGRIPKSVWIKACRSMRVDPGVRINTWGSPSLSSARIDTCDHLFLSNVPPWRPQTSALAYAMSPLEGGPPRTASKVKRGVAAGRSAQPTCWRSSDWRRGARRAPPTRSVNREQRVTGI